MEEIMEVSLLKASNKDLEEDAKDFIQDKKEPRNPFPLDETQEPPKPSIVLKPSFRFEIRFSK
jgi:hypothetical protein